MRYDGRVLGHVMGVLESIGAWCEEPGRKPQEQDEETVYSLEKIGEQLPMEILHSDSIVTNLVASYAKKFACSKEKVIEREGTGLRKREYTVEVTQAKREKLVSLATSTS